MLAEINWSVAWPIISAVFSICSAAICAMAMFIFNGFRAAIQKNSTDIEAIKDRMSKCRKECDDTHASKEEHNREAGYSRRFQERQIEQMAKIETLVNKMPEMMTQIMRAVMSEMKRGE